MPSADPIRPTDRPASAFVSPPDLLAPTRRTADATTARWPDSRDLLLASLTAPVRGPLHPAAVAALGLLVLTLDVVGLVTRLVCADGACRPGVARLMDLDALGSLPRTAVVLLLAAAGLGCLIGVARSSRAGARSWWSVLAVSCTLLALAKAWSVHSLLEVDLGGLLSPVDVQLLFVIVSLLGLGVVLLSGGHVRRSTRSAVLTWLSLYAVAAVGLAAVTTWLFGLAPAVGDLGAWVEESGEALAAVGLLAVVLGGVADLSRRRPDRTPAQ